MDLEYDFRLLTRTRCLFGDGDLEKVRGDLSLFTKGEGGDRPGEKDGDLSRLTTAPAAAAAASSFLRSFSRMIRSNSFRGSSMALQDIIA